MRDVKGEGVTGGSGDEGWGMEEESEQAAAEEEGVTVDVVW